MLAVSAINQYYGGSHALRNVSLDARPGACTAILGRNGVGKTTLLKCIMGLLPVASGTIEFEGADITHMQPYARAQRGLAYVPQGREIFPRLTVEENLRIGVRNGPDDFGEIYTLFPVLRDMRARRGGDLSGGQQQQLAIGRALLTRPRLLILDEPTEGIQPSIIKDIERVIRMLIERGDMAILLVEQYYDFARALAQQYVVLSRGEVVKHGLGSDMDSENVRALIAL